MKRHLIYIVEDDEGIQELYRGAFEDSYDVEIFNSGEEFFEQYKVCRPDLAILDIMLPGDDGFKVLTDLRKTDELLPVIIVSAKNDELSFVKGLNKGADDYMSKPFSVLELMARVRANLRRTAVNILRVRNIEIDSNTYAASVGGEKIELTLKEFLLLLGLLIITVFYPCRKCRRNAYKRKTFYRCLGGRLYGRNQNARYAHCCVKGKTFRAWGSQRHCYGAWRRI